MKKVFFDTTFLTYAKDLRGIPQVILQLAGLLARDARFADVHFVTTDAIFRRFLDALGVRRERTVEIGMVPLISRFERFHGLFSTFRYRHIAPRASLLIHPELRTVIRGRVPQMVIYYDFIPFEGRLAGGRRKWSRFLFQYYKNRRAARVAHKIAISGYTKGRALALFPAAREETIRVLHICARGAVAGEGARNPPGPAERLQFLYVGSYEARKNIDALLENYAQATGGLPADLHLAGWADAARRRDLEGRIARLGLSGNVVLHGLVTDGELKALYARAHFLLFPSLFEGFGLPIVEAMGHGVVVCAFDNSSIPEVGGGALVLCANDDFAGWGKRIAELAGDPGRYGEMSRKARERAAHFSEVSMMDRYAAHFLDVFAKA